MLGGWKLLATEGLDGLFVKAPWTPATEYAMFSEN